MTLSEAEIRRRLDPSRFCYTSAEGMPDVDADGNSVNKVGHKTAYEDGHTNKIAAVMLGFAFSTRTAWVLSLLLLVAVGRVCIELGLDTVGFLQHIRPLLQLPSLSSTVPTPPTASEQEILYQLIQGYKDFALTTNGGSIACPFTSGCKTHADVHTEHGSPSLSITDSLHAEDCWDTLGHSAELGVLLSQHLQPRYIALDHALAHIPGLHRAPRNVTVWGVVDGLKNRRLLEGRVKNSYNMPSSASARMVVPVATMYYSIHTPVPTQTFPVFDYIRDTKVDFSLFIFQIMDNWGAASTCLYRVRIYGEPVNVRTWFSAS